MPKFVTETNMPPPYRLCTMASGAMLADVRTRGAIQKSAQQMSKLAGTGLYPVSGTNLQDLAVAFHKLDIPIFNRRTSWIEVPQDNNWMVAQGSYGWVPPFYRIQKNYRGGHAIFCRVVGGTVFVMDPLGSDNYTHGWWPLPVFKDFMTHFIPGVCLYSVGPKYA